MLQKEQAFIEFKWVSKQNEQNHLKKMKAYLNGCIKIEI